MAWFPAYNTKALIDLHDKMRVQLVYPRRCYVAMVDMKLGLAPCNTNNFVVYGQKPKELGTHFLGTLVDNLMHYCTRLLA